MIQAGQQQNQASTENLRYKFLNELKKSLARLKNALLKKEKKKCTLDNIRSLSDLKFLSNAPHVYFALALLDGFNDNREGGIYILKQASEKFGDDDNLSPGVIFNINFLLADYLRDTEHDPENIFRHLDKALSIAQNTLGRIDKWKRLTTNPLKQEELLKAEKRFKVLERWAKNFLADFSAQVGAREFEALLYAKHNYDNRDKLYPQMKLRVMVTYGYVKMAFEARRDLPDFDEIEQAKALFQEALSHAESLRENNRYTKEYKRIEKKRVQLHLRQAKKLLASR